MKKLLLGLFLIGSALSFSAERVIKMEEAFVDNNDIIYVQGEKTPFTGIIEDYKAYLGEGLLEGKVPFKNGKVEGVQKDYYENGNLKRELPHKNGIINGIVKEYYPNGKLKIESSQKNGLPDGVSIFYDENGKVIEQVMFKDGKEVK